MFSIMTFISISLLRREARRPLSVPMRYHSSRRYPSYPAWELLRSSQVRNHSGCAASSTTSRPVCGPPPPWRSDCRGDTSPADTSDGDPHAARGRLPGFHQQPTQQRAALLADGSGATVTSRGILAGIQPQVTATCLPRAKRLAGPMVSTKASEVIGPTPGCVIRRTADAFLSASRCTARFSSSIR